MKKRLFFSFLTIFWGFGSLLAQGGLRMVSNVRLVCDGAVNVVINDGRFNNVSGTFTPGESTVKFVGTASTSNSLIQGQPFTFHNLMVHKNQNDVRLGVKISINNQLIFSQGDLDLNNTKVNLNTTNVYNGVFVNEREDSHTNGTASNSKVTKKITTTGPTQLSFDHLGILLVANGNFGNSSVDRRHTAMSLPTSNSILKHWRISTSITPGAQNGTVSLYYFEDELNGLNEGALSVWRSTDNGLTWADMGYSFRNSAQNYVKIINVSNIEAWWTLGEETPLQGPSEERAEAVESNAKTLDNPTAPLIWSISPNPVSGICNAQFHADIPESVSINFYSSDGRMVLSVPYTMQVGLNNCQLNLESLSPGVYVARITGHNYRPISLVKT